MGIQLEMTHPIQKLAEQYHRRVATKRDDSTHFALLNWGFYIRANMDPAPWEYPEAASWQRQFVNPLNAADPEPEAFIDAHDAEQTQTAMVRLMCADMGCARVLTQRYRDGWSLPGGVLRDCRKVFWRYL